nr:ribosomal protein S1 [Gloiopeltis furcata]
MNQGFTEKDFASMLKEYNYSLNPGDIVAGTIFNKESYGFLVNVGAEIAGFLPIEEVSLKNAKNLTSIYYLDLHNQTREFFIMAYKRDSKQLILSIRRLEYIRAWKRIKQIESEDIILRLKVARSNKGGAITLLEGLESFIPNSHLAIEMEMLQIKNSSISCKLLSANEKTNQLILSNKKAVLSITTNQLNVGDIVEGTVIKIEKYGVFVLIKKTNILALLHISELGYKNIPDIRKIFNINDSLEVRVIHIDIEQGRISVSQKDLN